MAGFRALDPLALYEKQPLYMIVQCAPNTGEKELLKC